MNHCGRLASNTTRQLARNYFRAFPSLQIRRQFVPWRHDPFEDIQKNFERMFRDFERATSFRPFFRPLLGSSVPVETYENGQRVFKLEVDLPDFKPEDIQVTVKNGEVLISAKSDYNEGSLKQHRQFSYRYSLPEGADLEKLRSSLKTDGRLLIEAPLPALEQNADKEIPIKRE